MLPSTGAQAVSDATIAAMSQQLAALGDPIASVYKGTQSLPKGTVYVYLLQYATQNLKLTVEIDKATNKFSGFVIGPP